MRVFRLLVVPLLCLGLAACSGGGDDNDNGGTACSTLGLKIINGESCKESGSPVARVTINFAGGSGICTGTLISSDDVLTAGHCAFEPSLGALQSATINFNGEEIPVDAFAVNPNYTGSGAIADSQFDTAIMHLSRAPAVAPVPLLLSEQIPVGATFTAYGYGLTEDGSSGSLLAAFLRVADVQPNLIINLFDQTQTNVCFGDSGGPAIFVGSAGQTGIVGTVSAGTTQNCLDGDVNFYTHTQTAENANWILSIVPDAAVN